MRHFCICISGYAGTGKDEIAKHLISKYKATRTGLADPMKRHMADVYGFSYQQLFGPSKFRNEGDLRYYKNGFSLVKCPSFLVGDITYNYHYDDHDKKLAIEEFSAYPRLGNRIFIKEKDPNFWLSPREALQKYGELLNNLYEKTLIKYGFETHRKLSCFCSINKKFDYSYNSMIGLQTEPTVSLQEYDRTDIFTCFSDFRHKHEINFIRSVKADDFEPKNQASVIPEFRPIVIRVKRKGIESPPFQHRSELEQATIPDSVFDFIIENNEDIKSLYVKVDEVVTRFTNNFFQEKTELA